MIAVFCAFTSVVLLAAAGRPSSHGRSPVLVARESTMDGRELRQAAETQSPLWQRLLAPPLRAVGQRVRGRWAGMTPADLYRAGVDPTRFSTQDLVAVKVLSAATLAALGIMLTLVVPGAVILVPAASFTGFVAPSLYLRRRRSARQRQLLRELPDLVGLLKAFVTAGISMEQALHLISEQQARNGTNLLATEVRHSLSDYGLGMRIDEALALMAERTGLEELDMLAAALAQGKRQGAGMERILRDQETVVRLQQRNRSTAEASRVGTRLVGVLVGVYLPEFMVLIMVPLFYGIFLHAFS